MRRFPRSLNPNTVRCVISIAECAARCSMDIVQGSSRVNTRATLTPSARARELFDDVPRSLPRSQIRAHRRTHIL